MVASLRLRTEQLAKYRTLAGVKTDGELAARMGIDHGNLSRVLAGKQAPGSRFIPALVAAFPGLDLDDLFEVLPATAAA